LRKSRQVLILLAEVLACLRPVIARLIEHEAEVAFRQAVRAHIGDERETVAVLEVSLGDDVALEACQWGNRARRSW
jgi:hypothetical protein